MPIQSVLRFLLLSLAGVFFSKPVLRAQCDIQVDAGPDIFLCSPPPTAQLQGSISGNFLDFYWTPTVGMTGATTLEPTVHPTQTTAYVLTGRQVIPAANLVINGDFEQGNTGFFSDYVYNPGDIAQEGTYDIMDASPWFNCPDHSGGGNMLMAHADLNINTSAWCQTVSVVPNTSYQFTAWVLPMQYVHESVLRVNGVIIASIPPNLGGNYCDWLKITGVWNSGSNMVATLCVGRYPALHHYFGVDDITFSEVCEVKDTVKVFVNPVVATTTPSTLTIPCHGFATSLNGAGSSTGPDISYHWETDDGHIVSGENTLSPSIDAAGTYVLTVTREGALGPCTKTAEVVVKADSMTAWILPVPPLDCGHPVRIVVGQASQAGPKTYEWTAGPGGHIVSGAAQPGLTVDSPGEYFLVITQTATGCTATATIEVEGDTEVPKAVAQAPSYFCAGQQTVALSAAGSSTGPEFSYNWFTPNGHILSGQHDLVATADTAGTYILQVKNETNQCVRSDTLHIQADTIPLLPGILSEPVFDCTKDSIVLRIGPAHPGVEISWTAWAGGHIVGRTDTTFAQISSPGVYGIRLLSPVSGCTATDTVAITSDLELPVALIRPPDTLNCRQTLVLLEADSIRPDWLYTWTTPDGHLVAGEQTPASLVDAGGEYYLQVTDTLNGCTASAVAVVAIDTLSAAAQAGVHGQIDCGHSVVKLDISGSSTGPGIVYRWQDSEGGLLPGDEPVVAAAGMYFLEVSRTENGCSGRDSVWVVEDLEAPEIIADVSGILNCHASTVVIQNQVNTGNDDLVYVWTLPDGSQIGPAASDSLSVQSPGWYTLAATNTRNGCSDSSGIEVIFHPQPVVEISFLQHPDCFGDSTGVIEVSASGGDGQFVYQWSTGAGPASLTGLTAGTYALTVSDGENCTATLNTPIITPPALSLNLLIEQPGMNSGDSGTARVFVSGGISPYGFAWSTGTTDSIVSGLSSGQYTVTVTDAKGCSTTETFTIFSHQCQLTTSIQGIHPGCYQGTDGSVGVTVSGGEGSLQYVWNTGDSSAALLQLSAGVYTVTVSDANGCTSVETEELIDPPALVLQLSELQPVSCPDAADGQWFATTTGGTGDPVITWSNGQSGSLTTGLSGGTLTVSATDAHGCTVVDSVWLGAVDQIPPLIYAADTVASLGPSGTITLTPAYLGVAVTDNCGVSDVAIAPDFFDCSDLGLHAVAITATDAAGNISTSTIQVSVVDNLAPALVCPADLVRCYTDRLVGYPAPVATDNCLSLGGQFDLLEGLPSGSEFPVGTSTNTYTFTDAQGNLGSCSFTVSILDSLRIVPDSLRHDHENAHQGGIWISVSGGAPPYTFEWSKDSVYFSGEEDLSQLGSGLFTLIVRDSMGCVSDVQSFVLDNLTSVWENFGDGMIRAYPNPTTGSVHLSSPGVWDNVEIRVYGALGEQVPATVSGTSSGRLIDLSALENGLYRIIVRTKDMLWTCKIIKIR